MKDLAEAFRDGVDERISYERFHFIGRQRIRHALYPLWRGDIADHFTAFVDNPEQLTEVAEWDARNGGIACEYHHRRFDNHLTPSLVVPADALPAHVIEFIEDWGLEIELQRRFPSPKPTGEELVA